MDRDEILMTAAGLALVALVVYGFSRYVLPETIEDETGYDLPVYTPQFRTGGMGYSPPVQNNFNNRNKAPAQKSSCGCY